MISDKDEELVALLKANARESVANLARKLNVSRSTVQDRLRRLEDSGVIAGYTVTLSEGVEQAGLRAFVTLSVEPRRTLDVVARLRSVPQVQALYTVSGKFDLVAVLEARSAERLDRLLDEIGTFSGVVRTESSVILSTKIHR